MKTTITHTFYGQITYDTQTGKVTVQKGDLAERLTWLIKPKNYHLLGTGYHPSEFLAACKVLGISEGVEKIEVEGEPKLPEGAVE